MTLPSLLWLREHRPAVWNSLAHVLLPKDYVRHCLCGDLATDPSDAAGTLLFDAHHSRWSAEMLAALELPSDILPRVAAATSVAGRLTAAYADAMGLVAGTR